MPNPRPEAVTMNQLVAYNLTRARELRGWSQAETVQKLQERAGVITNAANVSAAERSVTGQRRRQFDADDLLAYARTFELPITWFLLPGHPETPKLGTEDDPNGLPPTLVLDWLYRDSLEEQQRVHALTENVHAQTNHQHAIQERARAYAAELAAAALSEHATAPAALRALADAVDQALDRRVILSAGTCLSNRRTRPPHTAT